MTGSRNTFETLVSCYLRTFRPDIWIINPQFSLSQVSEMSISGHRAPISLRRATSFGWQTAVPSHLQIGTPASRTISATRIARRKIAWNFGIVMAKAWSGTTRPARLKHFSSVKCNNANSSCNCRIPKHSFLPAPCFPFSSYPDWENFHVSDNTVRLLCSKFVVPCYFLLGRCFLVGTQKNESNSGKNSSTASDSFCWAPFFSFLSCYDE